MRVFLDDRPVHGLPEGLVAGDAISYCAARVEAEGRLVTAVLADGTRLTEFRSIGPVAEIRLTTALPAQLLAEAYEAAQAIIGECVGLQASAAEAMMAGRIDEGTRGMQRVMETWGRLHQAIVQTEQFARRMFPKATAEGEDEIRFLSETLAGNLRDLKTAIGAEDWSAAADVLGVELQARCEQWGQRLAACRDAALAAM